MGRGSARAGLTGGMNKSTLLKEHTHIQRPIDMSAFAFLDSNSLLDAAGVEFG